MGNQKDNTKISKFLALVLRHQPGLIKISLDEEGWVAVPELLTGMKEKGFDISFDILRHVVDTNNKKRFAFNEDKTRIRASQGHSLEVNLGYSAIKPPATLYHGSAEKNRTAILRDGLHKGTRQHVHLSTSLQTARQVGQRHGKPVIFEVAVQQMDNAGYVFFFSENGVWLTDAVPAQYLTLIR